MWIKTDNEQWVKKNNDKNFEVIYTPNFPNEQYMVQHSVINLDNYSEEELENEVSAFYDSLLEIKEEYKENWTQIVAEIIAENSLTDYTDFIAKTEKELYEHLFNVYGIKEENQ